MKVNTKKNIGIFAFLLIIFSVYNSIVYNSKDRISPIKLSNKAIQGQILWQNNNCWSCHQIYGLGGYLGPDLTNIYSDSIKGPIYIKAFLNSGIKSMPKFNFSKDEQEAIVTFLRTVDSTGYYPNYEAEFRADGWVKFKYKNER